MHKPPDPSEEKLPPASGVQPERMNIDAEESIVDTSAEPAIPPFPVTGLATDGPVAPSTVPSEDAAALPNVGAPYYLLHPLLHIPVHSHGCPTCRAFLDHQGPSDPSWAHVQAQFRIHQRAQFDLGVARGLAAASERITAAEDNALSRSKRTLQAQLDTIRLEHAALLRDHANTEQALSRALAPSRARSSIDGSPSLTSQRRRSPRPDAKKRKRASPTPSGTDARRSRAPSGPPRTVSGSTWPDIASWVSAPPQDIHGPQWTRWVPISHADVSLIFARAASDSHALDRIRVLALAADGLSVAERTPIDESLQEGLELREVISSALRLQVTTPESLSKCSAARRTTVRLTPTAVAMAKWAPISTSTTTLHARHAGLKIQKMSPQHRVHLDTAGRT
ncbi:hypothetical protein FA95DRAFT_1606227 [Auriscalpium vulgare]|uniref:Uncharacterized protein n=1 Tax=Auriscalpium vulgare TaxID=40419 RepID=A0ACB8RSS7_9AGAM|nr:hypothetical protein FA95DRAFT_1606227 [Auriscalpium vulgare]